jgi:hypothetical protein
MGIKSPSKVGQGWGKNIGIGTAHGITSEASTVQSAVDGMVPRSPAASASLGGGASGNAGGAGGGSGDIHLTVKAEFPNAKSGEDVAQALTSSSFRTKFLQMIEREMVARGLPTQSKGD